MSKKDIIALADHLKGLKVPKVVMDALCQFCRSCNPNFKEYRFRDYVAGKCGPNGGAVKGGAK